MKITEHAMQRYAERVSEKEIKDVPVYVVQNKERIEKWINELFESSEYICSGKIKDHNLAHFYINSDGWCFVVADDKKDLIVTLYQIDLGVGKEFNKEYIFKIKETLKNQYENLKDKEIEIKEKNKETDAIISGNNDEIKILKKNIQYIEEGNILLQQQKKVTAQELDIKTKEFYLAVEKFLGNKIF